MDTSGWKVQPDIFIYNACLGGTHKKKVCLLLAGVVAEFEHFSSEVNFI